MSFNPFIGGGSETIDTTAYGTRVNVSMNSVNDDYIITISLINEDGNELNSQSIDLPIETLVKNGRYDSETKTIILILEDDTEIEIPIGDLISDLQTKITDSNKLNSDLVDDTNSTNKFVLNIEKTNWNNHIANINNPHNVTKAQIGLGNVDNTSDINKPISTATQTALDNKVNKETGKGLSTNDYTTTEKTKLAGIAEGAEVNVQSDWNQTDNSQDDYIKNKPNLAAVATSGSYTDLSDKPTIPAAQIQSDWNQTNNQALDYIKNKPIIPTTAAQISYDNTMSHLEATNTQAAIDELTTITYPSINITADNGAVITATNGAITLTATMEQSPLKMLIPSYGKWTFSASLNGKTISKIINFTASKIYNVELTFDNVYGVEWGLTGQTLSRTGAAVEFTNPVPYVNNGMSVEDCSSPFDNLYPWNGIIRETVDGNEVVKIPKFWYKIEKTNSKLSIQIADAPRDGFNVSPAHRARGSYPEQDYVYIGRYHSDSNYKSTSGVIPVVNITRATARTNQAAIGSGYYQLDFSLWVTIWMLYLVEFANWNSQSMIGYNCGNNSSKENTGSTDTMPYHTGTMQTSKTTYGVGVQYRYIEDPWGNVLDWCDGITFGPDENNNAGEGIYCFEDFADYSDSYNSANAVLVGRRANVSNYIQDFDQSNINGFDWVLYPGNGDTGSSQNQVPDSCYFSATGVVLCVGGYYGQYAYRGLFCLYGYYAASGQSGSVGVRLQKIPSIN